MCKPASMVVTAGPAVHWGQTDNHSELIASLGLHEDGVRGINLVRIELTPPGDDLSKPLPEWDFRVDQDIVPEWWGAESGEAACRAALVDWYASRVVVAGVRTVSDGHTYAIDSARVTANGSARVTAYDAAQVTANGYAQVTANGYARVIAYDSAQVTAYGSAQVTANGYAQVTANGYAQVTAYGSARVTAYGSAWVTANGYAQVTAYGSARVTANGYAQVTAYDAAQVTANGSARVTANDSAQVTANGASTVVQFGGTVNLSAPRTVCVDRRTGTPVYVIGAEPAQ